jgi:hypothetical protein
MLRGAPVDETKSAGLSGRRGVGALAAALEELDVMNQVRLFFAASVSIALAAACSSNDSGNGPGNDAGSTQGDAASADGGGGEGASNVCSPLSKCGQGLTCCFAVAGDPTGTCTAPSACTGAVSYQCLNASDCTGSQVCCLAGLNIASFDAAAFDGGLPPDLKLSVTCSAACTAQESQICQKSTECPPGQICETQTQAGVTAGFCTTPDAGGATSEAGSGGDGSASTPADGSTPADAATGG